MMFVPDLLPALLASAIPIAAGISSARLARRRVQAIALTVIATLSLIFGAWVFSEHAGDVSVGRALIGATIAAVFVGAIPLTVYFELGYRLRSRFALLCCWVIGAGPLYFYAIILLFAVVAMTQCRPNQYECPI